MSHLALLTGFNWVPHSTLTTGRYYHASEVLQNTLYLLGGDAVNTRTTTVLYNSTLAEGAWAPGFDLTEDTHGQCSVRISPSEIAVINSLGQHNRIYNVETGDATELLPAPPLKVSVQT